MSWLCGSCTPLNGVICFCNGTDYVAIPTIGSFLLRRFSRTAKIYSRYFSKNF